MIKRILKGFWNMFILTVIFSLLGGVIAVCANFPWLNLIWFIPFIIRMAWVFGE